METGTEPASAGDETGRDGPQAAQTNQASVSSFGPPAACTAVAGFLPDNMMAATPAVRAIAKIGMFRSILPPPFVLLPLNRGGAKGRKMDARRRRAP